MPKGEKLGGSQVHQNRHRRLVRGGEESNTYFTVSHAMRFPARSLNIFTADTRLW